jgi:biopolymer transport protein ExbB/TolQ
MFELIGLIASIVSLISFVIQAHRWYRKQRRKWNRERLAKEQQAKSASGLAGLTFSMSQEEESTSVSELLDLSRAQEEWRDWRNQDLKEMRRNGLPEWKIQLKAFGWQLWLIQARFLLKVTDLLVKNPKNSK